MRVFLYPYLVNLYNPYISNFYNALSKCNLMTNRTNLSSHHWILVDMMLKCLKTDVLILNWPENTAFRRGGVLQVFFYIITFFLYKILNKKIIYVYHNKVPHFGHSFLSRLCASVTLRFSSKIIVHAKSGISFLKSNYSFLSSDKIHFNIHPVYSSKLIKLENSNYLYDFIIWGSIIKYKGIVKFLAEMSQEIISKNIRLLIIGQCIDKNYYHEIKALVEKNKNIKFINSFVSDSDLKQYISMSKSILFVYEPASVLSSGSLMKSLNYSKSIIGPDSDGFRDLKNVNMINVYKGYEEIFSFSNNFDEKSRVKFLLDKTWDNLVKKIF